MLQNVVYWDTVLHRKHWRKRRNTLNSCWSNVTLKDLSLHAWLLVLMR